MLNSPPPQQENGDAGGSAGVGVGVSGGSGTSGGGMSGAGGSRGLKRDNPHKYLLYKPTFSQLMVFLASGFKELPANGAMLLYISADGTFPPAPKHSQDREFKCVCGQCEGWLLYLFNCRGV